MSGAASEWLELGYVARPHGVRGELRVVLHDGSDAQIDPVSVRIGNDVFDVLRWRPVKDAVLLEIAEVRDRDGAVALKGRSLAVPRTDLELAEGEVLLADLVGCVAELADGSHWGVVRGVERGVQDRLLVAGDGVMWELPLVDQFVLEIDVAGRRLVVAPPEGLPETPES